MEFLVQLLFLLALVVTWASAQSYNASNKNPFLPENCPKQCGNISINYPFGVGDGCFRQGFDLICDTSSDAPKLFMDNEKTHEITSIGSTMYATTGIHIMPSSVKKYNFTWSAPKNGPYSILDDDNLVTVIGCGIGVRLIDKNLSIGECTTFCISEKSLADANGSSCANIGCCQISIPTRLTSYTLELQRLAQLNSLSKIYDVKAFVSSNYYEFTPDHVYSSDVFNRSTKTTVHFDWNIPYPQTCKAAKRQERTYACLDQISECTNVTDIGYYCTCPEVGNPYIPHGCKGVNTNTRPDCLRKCGMVDIPFPFGLTQDCYRNSYFALVCDEINKPEPTLFFNYSTDVSNNYRVKEILIEEGRLRADTTIETIDDRAKGDD